MRTKTTNMMSPLAPRKVDRHLVLYGKGNTAALAKELFEAVDIPVVANIDKDSIQPIGEEYAGKYLIAVCVVSEPFKILRKFIKSFGYIDIVPVWDVLEAYSSVTGIHNGFQIPDARCKSIKRYKWVVSQFEAGHSRDHYRYFFGWHTGVTEHRIKQLGRNYDPLPSTLKDIRERQHVVIYEDAPMEAVDIHVEGFELDTIRMNLPLFVKYRPIINVACYHSVAGILEVPLALMKGLKAYNYYFTCYAYQGQAAYLYCVPKEKDK